MPPVVMGGMWVCVCRLNFTLSHLDVTCEAYDHFHASLHQLEKLQDGQLRFSVEPVEASFPQRLLYERIQQLVGAAAAPPPHCLAATCRSGVRLLNRATCSL